jgi:nitroreductase
VIRGAARERFGDVLAEALRRRSPDTAQAQLDRERKKPLRAPLMLAVCAVVDTASRIPAIEQILSAGAAAQNIMVAAHALRYGCFWRTGEPAYDPVVKAALGLREQDAIVGFLYLGTHAAPPPPPPPLDAQAFALEWPGPPTAWQALGGGL